MNECFTPKRLLGDKQMVLKEKAKWEIWILLQIHIVITQCKMVGLNKIITVISIKIIIKLTKMLNTSVGRKLNNSTTSLLRNIFVLLKILF